MPVGFIGAGNFIVDYVKTVDVYPAEQALANIRHEYKGSGGAPYNVLLNLSKLGAPFPLKAIGSIGEDETGKWIADDCANHRIDTQDLIVTPEGPTSYTLVMVVESTGKRTFFHQRGANALLGPGYFNFSGFAGWHLHLGYLLLLDGLDVADKEYGTAAARVLASAKEAGLTVSVDVVSEDSDRLRKILRPALKYTDLLFMNEFEAGRATGYETPREAYAALDFGGTLVLHWADGAAACLPDGSTTWQGSVKMPQDRIASVTGSGDAFAAGFLLSHLRSGTTQESLRMGVCAAAACITGYCCTDGMKAEAECLALGEKYGFREC